MLCLVFGKKSRTEDQITFAGVQSEYVYVNKQASLLAAAVRAVEVSGLKRDLERTEEELVLVKRQLEESQGTQYRSFIL